MAERQPLTSEQYFTNRTLTGTESHSPPGKCGTCGRCESHPNSYLKVDCLTHALPDLLEPNYRIRTVDHASQKSEPLGCILSVPPNIVLRDRCIEPKKTLDSPRLREDVSGVAKLRGFHNNGFLNVENVFLAKQIDPAGSA